MKNIVIRLQTAVDSRNPFLALFLGALKYEVELLLIPRHPDNPPLEGPEVWPFYPKILDAFRECGVRGSHLLKSEKSLDEFEIFDAALQREQSLRKIGKDLARLRELVSAVIGMEIHVEVAREPLVQAHRQVTAHDLLSQAGFICIDPH